MFLQKKESFFGHKVYTIDSIDYKLKFISDNCINFGEVDGLIERHKMYHYLFNTLLEGSEKGFVKPNIFRDYTDDGNPINSQLTIVINDKNRTEKLLYVENKNESGYSIVKKR